MLLLLLWYESLLSNPCKSNVNFTVEKCKQYVSLCHDAQRVERAYGSEATPRVPESPRLPAPQLVK